jgi:transmembrane sensor
MPYQSYSAIDFAMDKSFRAWILQKDEATNTFWNAWLAEHPEKISEVEEAKALVIMMHPRGMELSERDLLAMQQVIEMQTQEEPPARNPAQGSEYRHVEFRPVATRTWYRLAAGLIGLLILCGVYVWLTNTSDLVLRTRYGETATITLPDKSTVTLNGNSSLRYPRNWRADKPREVWLEGEAYFSVIHQVNHQLFTVHTTDALNVQVLGTQFNVASREGITQVVLSSGKVMLDIPGRAAGTGTRESLLMLPGDLVEFDAAKAQYAKRQVDTQHYLAWKDNILMFDKTSLSEIARTLQQTYGLQVTIKDSSLRDETFTGSVPSQDVDIILTGLAKTFDLKITRSADKKEVIISR